jgi:lipopolysaccharide transport system ATP-binding protein
MNYEAASDKLRMSETAILIQNVSKCFRRYQRPVDRLKELLLPGKARAQEFWALQNISIEILKGHTLGIVGRNGSGKSTLLQIIAGTLQPTTGQVSVQGRVSALLELGSGFNPEFTGRQNVFFNGRLLGLTQQEIEDKFEQILAFSEIADFIDQPVKTYSSGMFVRLAFAVAINTNPDILVVDEALSVGDEAFQRKCYGRIQDIQDRGGTVLFVSHSATTVSEFCDSAILLDHGELLLKGTAKLVISKYHNLIYAPLDRVEAVRQEIRELNQFSDLSQEAQDSSLITETSQVFEEIIQQSEEEIYIPNLVPKSTISYVSHGAKIENPYLTTLEGRVVNVLVRRKTYIYTYTVQFSESAYTVSFGMLIKTVTGLSLGGASSHQPQQSIDCIKAGAIVQVKFTFQCLLQPGVYFLNAGVVAVKGDRPVFLDRQVDVAMFRVQPQPDLIATGDVDFLIEPTVEIIQPVGPAEKL